MFNQAKVKRVPSQKYLGAILDAKINFNEHHKIMINKLTKGISMLRKLRYYIPRHSLTLFDMGGGRISPSPLNTLLYNFRSTNLITPFFSEFKF